mmetsp:Transcript_30430/g.86787  ORF Transcript_30430/g.86787 Transcript_30430/m.86787 type:complete len:417 (+) Transcript_30430:113-1363(+)
MSLELLDDGPPLEPDVWVLPRLRVLPPVLLLPRRGFPHDPPLAGQRLDHLWHMVVSLYPPDLGQPLELFHQGLAVCDGALFARVEGAELMVGLRLPQPDVGVLRAGQDEAAVRREVAAQHPGHPFCVVDIHRALFANVPHTHGGVVACRHELLACGRIANVERGHDVVPVALQSRGQLAHVERVQVAVLVGHGEVRRDHGVPSDGVRAHLQYDLPDGRVGPYVVQADGAVHRGRSYEGGLRRVEAAGDDALAAPLERRQRRGALVVPDVDCVARRHEEGLLPMVVDGVRDGGAVEHGSRLGIDLGGLLLQRPHLHRLVVPAGEHLIPGVADSRVAHEAGVSPGHHAAAGQVLQVPTPQLAVAAAADERRARAPGHGHALDRVEVALQRPDERLREDLLHLRRNQGALVLPRSLEWV